MTSVPSSSALRNDFSDVGSSLSSDDISKLQNLIVREDIKTISNLVSTYERINDPELHELLRKWVERYLKFICDSTNLNGNDIEPLFALTRIHDDSFLVRLFKTVIDFVKQNGFTKENVSMLENILEAIKSKSLDQISTHLEGVCLNLTKGFEEKTTFSRRDYDDVYYGVAISFLKLSILKFKEANIEKKKVIKQIKSAMEHVEANQTYFLFMFYSRQLHKILIENETKLMGKCMPTCMPVSFGKFLLTSVLVVVAIAGSISAYLPDCGILTSLMPALSPVAALGIPTCLPKCETLTSLFKRRRVRRRKWDRRLKKIDGAAEKAKAQKLFDPMECICAKKHETIGCWRWLKRNKKKRMTEKEKMWECSLIITLRTLAEEGFAEAKNMLLERGRHSTDPNSCFDPDIFETLLISLYAIYKEPDREIKDALENMCLHPNPELNSRAEGWLHGKTLQNKLNEKFNGSKDDTAFETTQSLMGLLTPQTIEQNLEDLRTFYKNIGFKTAVSSNGQHCEIKDLKWKINEQSSTNSLLEKEVELNNLCGYPDQEPQRIMVTSDSEEDNTNFCKRIAFEWANGSMFGEFKVVYLVSVATLNTMENCMHRSGKELAVRVQQSCFPMFKEEGYYNSVEIQVENDFDKDTTLFILDGGEKANEFCQKMLSSELSNLKCKIIAASKNCSIVDSSWKTFHISNVSNK